MKQQKNKFNVIIERNGEFEPYDVLSYLDSEWKKLSSRAKPTQDKINEWVKKELMYQYWGRCQYEIILDTWPQSKNGDKQKKIDIYNQCLMNLDLIVRLFKENVGKI